MNKKILIVIIIFVLVIGFFVLQKVIPSEPTGKYKIEESTQILNSNNGYQIAVRVIGPKFSEYPNEKFPAVLRIGGGWGTSSFLLNSPNSKGEIGRASCRERV